MKDFYKDAGLRILTLRSTFGYSREHLAEMADISTKFLYEIEVGKKGFSAKVLFKVSSALKSNCDYILTGKNPFIKLIYCRNISIKITKK